MKGQGISPHSDAQQANEQRDIGSKFFCARPHDCAFSFSEKKQRAAFRRKRGVFKNTQFKK